MCGGMSKRFKADVPKVIYPINEKPMIIHILEKCYKIGFNKIIIVVGVYEELIKNTIKKYYNDDNIIYVRQEIANGTAGAILPCMNYIKDLNDVYILSGDVPFISVETIKNLKINSILITKLTNPYGNGRIIIENGKVIKIIEEKDCTDEQKLIQLVNCGIYHLSSNDIVKYLPLINNNNKSGEYYLTDIVELINNLNYYELPNSNLIEIYNINTMEDLQNAINIYNKKID